MFGPDPSIQSPSLVADGRAAFLADRLVEELALLWERDDATTGPRPGLAARLQVVDDLLRRLRAGRSPGRVELQLLLHAYRGHPRFDPAWTRL